MCHTHRTITYAIPQITANLLYTAPFTEYGDKTEINIILNIIVNEELFKIVKSSKVL